MKTECLIVNVECLKGQAVFMQALGLIKDKARKEKIEGYKTDKDKALSLGVGLLLQYALKQKGIKTPTLFYSEFGKPSLEGENVSFNMSHSGDYAVIAISSRKVGVDIERIKPLKHKAWGKVFTSDELDKFDLADEKNFFRLWTKKESYVKFLGASVSSMHNFQVVYPSSVLDEVEFFTTEINEHIITVCHEKGQVVEMKEIDLSQLLQINDGLF